MKKIYILLFILLVNSFEKNTLARSATVAELPTDQKKLYDSFRPSLKFKAKAKLQKIGNYDPERIFLDHTGQFFVIEDSFEKIVQENGTIIPPISSRPGTDVISDQPPSGYTIEGIPIFHSLPGSSNVIYLNFIGGHIEGRAWNEQYGLPAFDALPYNPDNSNGYSLAEQKAMANIWKRVSEDYSSWQIDVTTERPLAFNTTTLEVMITQNMTASGSPMPASSAGGIAYLDIYSYSDATYYSPAFIYSNNLIGGREDVVAEATSHEIGHNFGLSHDGVIGGSPYYSGDGSGEISWGPIMGAAYFRSVTKFNNGDYANANNKENDIEIISRNLQLKNDVVGNTILSAMPLIKNNGTFRYSGIIENYDDIDVFSLDHVGGSVSVLVSPFRSNENTFGNNVDLAMQLLDMSGNILAISDPTTTSVAALTVNNLPSSTYYIKVYSVGNPVTPYSAYGGMGQYDLSGTYTVDPCVRANPTVILNPNIQSSSGGGTLNYSVSIKNNDSSSCGASQFNLTSSVPTNFKVNLSVLNLVLESGATGNVNFGVTSPIDAAVGNRSVAVTATHSNLNTFVGTGIATYVVTPACINAAPTLSVTPASQNLIIGGTVTYVVSVKNNDSLSCSNTNYSFSYSRPDGISTAWSSISIQNLPPGQTGKVNVNVFVVNPSLAPGSYIMTINTQGGSTPLVSASVMIQVQAPCVRANPSVVLTPSTQSSVAGGLLSYTLSIKNNDSSTCDADKFNLNSLVPSGFNATFSVPNLSLMPNATGNVTVQVTSPVVASVGSNTISVTATHASMNALFGSAHATYVVSPNCVAVKPYVTVNIVSQVIPKGTSATYRLNISNKDSETCPVSTFLVATRPPTGLTTALTAPFVKIAPGKSGQIGIVVSVGASTISKSYNVLATISDTLEPKHTLQGGVITVVP